MNHIHIFIYTPIRLAHASFVCVVTSLLNILDWLMVTAIYSYADAITIKKSMDQIFKTAVERVMIGGK
jgi:hypothetical protein